MSYLKNLKITRTDVSISHLCLAPKSCEDGESLEQAARRIGGIIAPGAKIEIISSGDDALIAAPIRASIEAIYDAIIAKTLQGRDASMMREAIYLQNLVVLGKALTDEQNTSVAMFNAVNVWETEMIDVREKLIAAGDLAGARDDSAWPPPPDGLTDFLNGF